VTRPRGRRRQERHAWLHGPVVLVTLTLAGSVALVLGATAFGEVLISLTGEESATSSAGRSLGARVSVSARAEPSGSRGDARTPLAAAPTHPVAQASSSTPTPAATPTPPTPSPAPSSAPPTTPSASPTPSPGSGGGMLGRLEADVVDLTNQARQKHGCGAVTADPRLAKASRDHSRDMVEQGYFDHVTPDGVDPWARAHRAGYADPASENIAMGQRSPSDVVDAWLASPGHRANILDCAVTDVGVGLAYDENGTPYWTQMFGRG